MHELGEELPRVLHALRVDESCGDMDPVGELVALHAQSRGHRAHALQPLRERDELGAIADHGDGAERTPFALDRTRVEVEHPFPEHDLGERPCPGGRIAHRVGKAGPVQRHADEVAHSEQALGGGVADPHDAALVDREHPVVHAVQHGGLVLHERDQLLRLHAEGEPLPAAAQHERRDARQQQRSRGGDADHREQRRQVVEHSRAREADADLADRYASVVPHGHLRARRVPERAGLPFDDLVPGEHILIRGAHLLP